MVTSEQGQQHRELGGERDEKASAMLQTEGRQQGRVS